MANLNREPGNIRTFEEDVAEPILELDGAECISHLGKPLIERCKTCDGYDEKCEWYFPVNNIPY